MFTDPGPDMILTHRSKIDFHKNNIKMFTFPTILIILGDSDPTRVPVPDLGNLHKEEPQPSTMVVSTSF